jgi:transcriptional regulator with XRE-family HTH domain
MAARKKKAAGKRKTGGSGARKQKTGRAARSAGPAAEPRSRVASLADRLTELVEQVAADALRGVVDRGGRQVASRLPHAREMRREAGAYLRELREVAGLTRDELTDALELGDQSLLEAVEAGTTTLSFELTLRLAAVLARHDPAPFVSKLVRSYNPVLWQLLEDWGVGRLPLQLEREREFVNILRGHDAVRALSDRDFAQVLDFTRAAFETALHFAEELATDARPESKPQRSAGPGGTSTRRRRS